VVTATSQIERVCEGYTEHYITRAVGPFGSPPKSKTVSWRGNPLTCSGVWLFGIPANSRQKLPILSTPPKFFILVGDRFNRLRNCNDQHFLE